MSEIRSNRFNVQLDDAHAAKLHALAERTYVNPGTLARSLLSTALDQADADGSSVADVLDRIPGAFERAQQGASDAAAGRVITIDSF